MPVCLPAILEISRYLFVNAMTTVSAVMFLYSPDTVVASVAIVNLDEAGDIGAAAAMATLDRGDLGAGVRRLPCPAGVARPPHAGLETIMIRGNDPILLTPGPLTTSLATKAAMLRDWGSWDASFNAITATIRRDLVDVVHGAATHVCVPLQGSGTFSVEAALGNLVPREGKVLVPQNGAYCQRIVKILEDPRPGARHARPARGPASDRRDGGGGARRPIRRSRTWRRCTARPAPASSTRCPRSRRPARATARDSSWTP